MCKLRKSFNIPIRQCSESFTVDHIRFTVCPDAVINIDADRKSPMSHGKVHLRPDLFTVCKRLDDADCLSTGFGNFRVVCIGFHSDPVDNSQALCRLRVFFHRAMIEPGFVEMRKGRHHDRRRETLSPELHRDIRHVRPDDTLLDEDFIQKPPCMPACVRRVLRQRRDKSLRSRPVCFSFHSLGLLSSVDFSFDCICCKSRIFTNHSPAHQSLIAGKK